MQMYVEITNLKITNSSYRIIDGQRHVFVLKFICIITIICITIIYIRKISKFQAHYGYKYILYKYMYSFII
jgi:hypothetical protein